MAEDNGSKKGMKRRDFLVGAITGAVVTAAGAAGVANLRSTQRKLRTPDAVEAGGKTEIAESFADSRPAYVGKVAHHGSRTSSTAAFLEAVSPSVAIASLGLDNQFRFPAPEVVARYEARDIRLLRTDRDGAVHLTIASDGRIETETFRTR